MCSTLRGRQILNLSTTSPGEDHPQAPRKLPRHQNQIKRRGSSRRSWVVIPLISSAAGLSPIVFYSVSTLVVEDLPLFTNFEHSFSAMIASSFILLCLCASMAVAYPLPGSTSDLDGRADVSQDGQTVSWEDFLLNGAANHRRETQQEEAEAIRQLINGLSRRAAKPVKPVVPPKPASLSIPNAPKPAIPAKPVTPPPVPPKPVAPPKFVEPVKPAPAIPAKPAVPPPVKPAPAAPPKALTPPPAPASPPKPASPAPPAVPPKAVGPPAPPAVPPKAPAPPKKEPVQQAPPAPNAESSPPASVPPPQDHASADAKLTAGATVVGGVLPIIDSFINNNAANDRQKDEQEFQRNQTEAALQAQQSAAAAAAAAATPLADPAVAAREVPILRRRFAYRY
ncbi:hypothetical protein HGRIS_008915 [Hohenbuehelia grisea]|uniref:Uncharacterized protein n=2 Tax=Hohenbuehelia grisea TaxID=104357 RepID=A0ABR3IZQ2_9AGAR